MKDLSNDLIEELSWRDILKDVAHEEKLNWILNNKDSKFYIGIDPTANSLHIGHYISIVVAKLINQIAKIEPVFVIGGLSGQIGDPSGKNIERQIINKDSIEANAKAITAQITNLAKNINISKFEIFNNIDIYKSLSIADFFQIYGKNFNLNSMLGKEMIKNRIKTGISYTEFSYQVFQAIDFLYLFREKNVRLQVGGSDQWGNIISGIDLIRKMEGIEKSVSGFTMNLLVDEQGNKIGKTGGNALWLDKRKTSPYQLYQYFINMSDELALDLIKKLTIITREELKELRKENAKQKQNRLIQKELAKRIIENVHSIEDYQKSLQLSEILFYSKYENLNKDHFIELEKFLPVYDYKAINIDIFLLVNKILNSKREIREFYNSKAIRINGIPIDEIDQKLDTKDMFINKYLILNIGKKNKILIKK